MIKIVSIAASGDDRFEDYPIPKSCQVIISLALCLAVVLSAPVDHVSSTTQPPVAILESSHEKHEDGSYNFSYLGEDGTNRLERILH